MSERDKNIPNIRQTSQLNKELLVSYQKIEGKDVYQRKILINRILDFTNDCRYIINRGSIPSNPKKKLADKTIKTLKNYIYDWSDRSLEIKRTMPSITKVSQYRYERLDYQVASQEQPAAIPMIPHRKSGKTRKRIRLRTIIRDFYSGDL